MQSLELVFESHGQPNACPLVILHGFLASARNWRTVAKRLAEKHQVYVLDMRNHGASPHHEQMNYPAMAQDVLAFLDALGVPKAHVLGHSMGGKIAMCLALSHPHRIANLLVADIAPVSYEHDFAPMIRALRQLPLAQLRNRKDAELHLAEAIPDLEFRQFLLQNLLLKDGAYYWRINLDIIHKNAHHIVGFPEHFTEAFAEKALFIAGEKSAYVRQEAVLTWFPHAEIVQIPDTGHWLYVEAPDVFCQLVADWISAVQR